MHKIALDKDTNINLSLFLVENAVNLRDIRQEVLSGNLDCCLIKPALIVDILQVAIAGNKAAVHAKENKLITRSLNTELLFNLSTVRNISQSLKNFGAFDDDLHCLVAVFEEEEGKAEKIQEKFQGNIVNIDQLGRFTDEKLVKKTYKVPEEELNVSSLANSVITRLAIKDLDFSR